MGLFDKKYCDICGDKIGLLGNKKLEDGNMCKNCAKKLSPFFSDRRSSTVAQIREQLAYREANRDDVAAFHTTRSIGSYTRLLLDEDAKKFMVTSARNLEEANPDVLDYSQVTGCELDVDESRTELKQTVKDGDSTKEVSFTPPRYTYDYDFYIVIHVNHPYFDTIRFQLNDGSVEIGPVIGTRKPSTLADPEYQAHVKLGEEIKQLLTEARESQRRDSAPRTAVECPHCGATTIPDASGCCEYCGSALG